MTHSSRFSAELIGGPFDGRRVVISFQHAAYLWDITVPAPPGPNGGNRFYCYRASKNNIGMLLNILSVGTVNYVYLGTRSGKGDSVYLSNMVPE